MRKKNDPRQIPFNSVSFIMKNGKGWRSEWSKKATIELLGSLSVPIAVFIVAIAIDFF